MGTRRLRKIHLERETVKSRRVARPTSSKTTISTMTFPTCPSRRTSTTSTFLNYRPTARRTRWLRSLSVLLENLSHLASMTTPNCIRRRGTLKQWWEGEHWSRLEASMTSRNHTRRRYLILKTIGLPSRAGQRRISYSTWSQVWVRISRAWIVRSRIAWSATAW